MIVYHLLHAASTTSTTVAQTATTVAKKASGGSIFDPIAKPIAALLAAIYSVIPNYGIAIMVLSLVWMILISPLTLKSTRSMLAMQQLQPKLKRLQEQHRDDRQAFAQAQMDLFREHNVSPFGSCLPMLLPLPVFFALYRVISGLSHISNGVPTPKYLSHGTRMYKDIVSAHGHLNAFGMDLAQKPLSHHSSIWAAAPFWIVLLIMAATSYLQTAQMMSRNPANQNNPQMRIMRWMPLLFAVFCVKFPAGVIVYYATSNICRIVQQDAMYRFDPKVKALVVQEVVEVEERTHELDEKERQKQNRPGYTPPRGPKQPPAGGGTPGSKKPPAKPSGGPGGTAKTPAKAPAKATTAKSGRPGFRELWAQAAEQQKVQQESKAGSGKGRAPSGGNSGSGGNGKGAPSGGASGANKSRKRRES